METLETIDLTISLGTITEPQIQVFRETKSGRIGGITVRQ
jgi:hypothetical protein